MYTVPDDDWIRIKVKKCECIHKVIHPHICIQIRKENDKNAVGYTEKN
jgi:hypothetical protein